MHFKHLLSKKQIEMSRKEKLQRLLINIYSFMISLNDVARGWRWNKNFTFKFNLTDELHDPHFNILKWLLINIFLSHPTHTRIRFSSFALRTFFLLTQNCAYKPRNFTVNNQRERDEVATSKELLSRTRGNCFDYIRIN